MRIIDVGLTCASRTQMKIENSGMVNARGIEVNNKDFIKCAAN